MQILKKIKFPQPRYNNMYYTWENGTFIFYDDKQNKHECRIIEYSENYEGWTDHLTEIHEENHGNSHPIDIFSRNNCIKYIKKFQKINSPVILEIGCSSGYLLENLIAEFPESLIIGADIVKEPIYKLSKKLIKTPLIRFDLLKNPFNESFADVITLLNVAEHISDDNKAFKECFKILKPNGILIIEVPAFQMLYDSYDKELKHYRRYNLKELEQKLKNIGFKIEFKSYLGFFLFPLFFIVKLINKILGKKNVSISQSKKSNNIITKILLKIEEDYFTKNSLPFGIRCFVCAKKN
jgi:SAM-dependent methyltransferase